MTLLEERPTAAQVVTELNSRQELPPRSTFPTSNEFFENDGLAMLARVLNVPYDYNPDEKEQTISTKLHTVTVRRGDDNNWSGEVRLIPRDQRPSTVREVELNPVVPQKNQKKWFGGHLDRFLPRSQPPERKKLTYTPPYEESTMEFLSLGDRAVIVNEEAGTVTFVDPAPPPSKDDNYPEEDYPHGFGLTTTEFSRDLATTQHKYGIQSGIYHAYPDERDPKKVALRNAALQSRELMPAAESDEPPRTKKGKKTGRGRFTYKVSRNAASKVTR